MSIEDSNCFLLLSEGKIKLVSAPVTTKVTPSQFGIPKNGNTCSNNISTKVRINAHTAPILKISFIIDSPVNNPLTSGTDR